MQSPVESGLEITIPALQQRRLRDRALAASFTGAAVLSDLAIPIEGSRVGLVVKIAEGLASALSSVVAVNRIGSANDHVAYEALLTREARDQGADLQIRSAG